MNRLFFFLIIIPSAILHEYAHGFVADLLGDGTARRAGRLTLNPIAHIDLWGTILMPLFLYFASGGAFVFAYAKPVPFNPYNLKNQQWGPAMVGVAGPLTNLVLAAVFGIFFRFVGPSPLGELLAVIVYANVLLAVFNLVPIPPLDGSKVLYAFLPPRYDNVKFFLDRFGIFLLLIFIFFFFELITPIMGWLFKLFVGTPVGF